MVKEYTDFGKWFIEEEIHEVVSSRSQLLAEYLYDLKLNQKSVNDVHQGITKIIHEAYEFERKGNG